MKTNYRNEKPRNPKQSKPFSKGRIREDFRKKDVDSNDFEKKSFEKKPFEKKPFEKKTFEKKPFEKKPFEKNFFDKKPFKEHDANYNPHAKYSLKKQIEYKKQHLRESTEIRLNRFLANAGFCSRREADEFIKAGVVSVNGNIVTELGTKISPRDKVLFYDQLVKSEKKVYLLLNKPKDCVTTSDDPQERFTVMDLIKGACQERIYPVGRLDRNTTGVMLLTNDGDLAARLMHPKYNKKKIYHIFLDKALTKADMENIAKGVELEDGMIAADSINYVDETDKKQVGIEIHSGKNRIVRRIFEHFGYKVEKLDRVYFAGLTKKNLPRGKYRFLTEKEINMLNMGAFQ